MVQSLRLKESLVALLDSRYTRCLVNPVLIEKPSVRLKQFKVPIFFVNWTSQWQENPSNICYQTNRDEYGRLRETWNFIIAPDMERPLVLGLSWLLKWNPYMNWRSGLLKIQQSSC